MIIFSFKHFTFFIYLQPQMNDSKENSEKELKKILLPGKNVQFSIGDIVKKNNSKNTGDDQTTNSYNYR